MKTIHIDFSDERLITPSGLVFVGQILGKSNFVTCSAKANRSTKPSALENGYVPMDIDVTPFDNSKTKKEGVSRTYKGFDGYAQASHREAALPEKNAGLPARDD